MPGLVAAGDSGSEKGGPSHFASRFSRCRACPASRRGNEVILVNRTKGRSHAMSLGWWDMGWVETAFARHPALGDLSHGGYYLMAFAF